MRLFAFYLFFISFSASSSDRLLQYYKGSIDLEEAEIIELVETTIDQPPSSHLLSYAYYLKAIRYRKGSEEFLAFEAFDYALEHFLKSDTNDYFLHFSILNKQGVILKNNWMIDDAIEKYKQALEPAYAYNLKCGLSVKYNLARALAYKDSEKALKLLVDIIDEAMEEGLNYRVTKTINEVGLMLVRSGEYDAAPDFFDRALKYADDIESKGYTYQNYAHLYYKMGDYADQQHWLSQSLALGDHSNRFITLMDMGENCLIRGDTAKALTHLLEAESLYNTRPLKAEYVKVFQWLAEATRNEQDRSRYYKKRGDDMAVINETQELLEAKLRQKAMLQLFLRLEAEKSSRKLVGFWKILAIAGGCTALVVLFTWRIWWVRLRKRLSEKIVALGKRWEKRMH